VTIEEKALEAVAQAIHDHWQGAPSRAARPWEQTCEKLPGQAEDFRKKARAAILAYEANRAGQEAAGAPVEDFAVAVGLIIGFVFADNMETVQLCARNAQPLLEKWTKDRLDALAAPPKQKRDAVIEECAAILDAAAQEFNRIRDPGMANQARSYARRIRALKSSNGA